MCHGSPTQSFANDLAETTLPVQETDITDFRQVWEVWPGNPNNNPKDIIGVKPILIAIVTITMLRSIPLNAAVSYIVRDLGAVTPTGINDNSQIVGNTTDGRAFVFDYKGQSLAFLPPLSQGGTAVAEAINNAGVIVGSSVNYACRWNPSSGSYVATALAPLGSGMEGVAYAINNTGEIVGQLEVLQQGSLDFLPFMYTVGPMVNIGAIGVPPPAIGVAGAAAFGVNNSGQIVGVSPAFFGFAAFIYQNGQMQQLFPNPDLGSGAIYTQANAINNLGQVVGTIQQRAFGTDEILSSTAFIYSTNTGRQTLNNPLGGQNAEALGINDSGTIVGYSYGWGNVSYVSSHAAIWTMATTDGIPDPTKITDADLNTLLVGNDGVFNPHWVIQRAIAINSAGQILALGINLNSIDVTVHGLLVIPPKTPAELALSLVGAPYSLGGKGWNGEEYVSQAQVSYRGYSLHYQKTQPRLLGGLSSSDF